MGAAPTASAKGSGGNGGANTSGPYDPHNVGGGTNQGHSPNANGTRGKADAKNPPGQVGNTHSRGYECNNNKGVGDKGGNPAHSGCSVVSPPGGDGDGDNGDGDGDEVSPPGDGDGDGDSTSGGGTSVSGSAPANQPVPTVVNAGLESSAPSDGALIGAGALASLVAGAAILLARRRLRSES